MDDDDEESEESSSGMIAVRSINRDESEWLKEMMTANCVLSEISSSSFENPLE